MSSMFALIYLQDLDKLNYEVLDFLLFIELNILEWLLT